MSLQIRINTLSPGLARMAKKVGQPRPILEAMGLQLVSLTKRAFRDETLRPSPWAPRKSAKGGSHQLLRKSGALFQSITITNLNDKTVTVGSDRTYAAAHQLGSEKKNIPARPFCPFVGDKMTPTAEKKIESVAKAKINSLLGP